MQTNDSNSPPETGAPAASPHADDAVYKLRHSLAHILAQAVMELRPGTKLGFGPPIDNGFYYDFILPSPITEEDFPEIEKKMKHLLKQNQKFEYEDLPREKALAQIESMQEPYKREYAAELLDKKGLDGLRFYRNGKFIDMCEGPHVETTRQIPGDCFKLRSVAGAYWRGDSSNQMMTRIYAWAYATKAELDVAVKAHAEALARDHKKLGKELDIFHIDDEIGKGLPLWLPNGTVIRDELENLAKELEFEYGYVRVATPHLAKTDLYYKTGHLPYYAVHMYPFMEMGAKKTEEGEPVDEASREVYCLKPMNCPHHHKIFAARPRSYRDLPLRLAEYGQVYRYEDSGAVSGLLRVRGMCMNDAHIYCTKDQIAQEFASTLELNERVYKLFGFKDYYYRFSTRNPNDPEANSKFVDNPAAWDESEAIVHQVLLDLKLPFKLGPGEAAFYGPKIDIQFRTVTGREETASTVQLDFAVPPRLDLKYIGSDNAEHHPYVIHRAPLGTHERFVAFLIEHYAGAFPTWLAPVQVRVLPVGESFADYGREIVKELRASRVRAEIDDSSDTISKKIRNAAMRKIPNQLIIGEREKESGTVTLRRHGIPASEAQQTMPRGEFKAWVLKAIAERSGSVP